MYCFRTLWLIDVAAAYPISRGFGQIRAMPDDRQTDNQNRISRPYRLFVALVTDDFRALKHV